MANDGLSPQERLQRAGLAGGLSGLTLFRDTKLIAADDSQVTRYSVKAEDLPPDQHAVMARGKLAATAMVPFELMSSDINFHGLYINTSWITEVDLQVNRKRKLAVEQVVAQSYGPNDRCMVNITGEATARDVVAFLRGLHHNVPTEGPSQRTLMVLMKEWK